MNFFESTKTLMVVAAFSAATTVSAQSSIANSRKAQIQLVPSKVSQQAFTKQETNLSQVTTNGKKAVPTVRKASQLHVGNVTDDTPLAYTLALGAGTTKVCAHLSLDLLKKYTGCNITGVRIGLAKTASVASVEGWISEDPSATPVVNLATGQSSTFTEGWNDILFSKPYMITGNEQDFYMGATVEMADNQGSICTTDLSSTYGFLYESNGYWYDGTSNYGTLAIQLIVEGNLPDYDVTLKSFSTDGRYYKSSENDSLYFYVELSSSGIKDIPSLTLQGIFDGDETKSFQLAIQESITGRTSSLKQGIKLSEFGLEAGQHTLVLRALGTADGTAMSEGTTDDDAVASSFAIYSNGATRSKILMEVFCNQYSQADSLETEILERMMSTRSDIAPVFIHGDFFGEEYADLNALPVAINYASSYGLNAVPTMLVNRFMMPGAETIDLPLTFNMIGYSGYVNEIVNYINSLSPAFCSLTVKPISYDEKTGKITIEVSGTRTGDFSKIFQNGAVTLYLTEDNVVGPQDCSYSMCENYVHNHVLRYVATADFGDEITWNGLRFTKSFTIDTGEGWNIENMKAIAFVSKTVNENSTLDNIDVTNAADVSLTGIASGIATLHTDDAHAKAEFYTLDGIRINESSLGHGIFIQKKGSKTVKVVR